MSSLVRQRWGPGAFTAGAQELRSSKLPSAANWGKKKDINLFYLMVPGPKAFWQLHTGQRQTLDMEMFLSWGFQIWLLITTTWRAFKNYRFPGPWALGKIQTKQTQGGTWKSAFSQGPCGSANCQHRPDPQVLSVLGPMPIKLSEGLLVPAVYTGTFFLVIIG